MKLTPPQLRLLQSLAEGPQSVHEDYVPATKLISFGLARRSAPGFLGGSRVELTEGGRNHLWTPKHGDQALFVKSGNLVSVQDIHPDGTFTVTRVDTSKRMLATRAGLVPVPVEADA